MAEYISALKGTEVIKTACYLCHGGCILLAHIKDKKLVDALFEKGLD